MSLDLLGDAIVKLQSLDPPPRQNSVSYDENARYEYKVQGLIDLQLTFERGVPLVNDYPLSLQVQTNGLT